MTQEEFEQLGTQKYRNEKEGVSYLLEYQEEGFFTIRLYDDRFVNLDDYDGEYIGSKMDTGGNIAVMAWEYNAVPVKGVAL